MSLNKRDQDVSPGSSSAHSTGQPTQDLQHSTSTSTSTPARSHPPTTSASILGCTSTDLLLDLPRSSRPQTPLRPESCSELGTTLELVRPILERQLDGHQWTEKHGDAFFDWFFPPPSRSSPLPILSPLTIDSTEKDKENAVIKWVTDTQPICAKRSWVSAADIPILHNSGISRKLPNLKSDLFTYRKEKVKSDKTEDGLGKATWERVVSIVKIKWRTRNDPTENSEFLYQMAQYARAVFGTQPGRMFVHGIIIVGTKMRCWIFTRSGVNGSRDLDLTLEKDLKVCSRVLYAHATLSEQDMGMLKQLSSNVPVKFAHTGRNFALGSLITLTNIPSIVGRATTVWVAKNAAGDEREYDFVVKLSHQFRGLVREGELYRQCSENPKVKGIAKCYGYRELDSVHKVLGNVCVSSGTILPRLPTSQVSSKTSSRSRRGSLAGTGNGTGRIVQGRVTKPQHWRHTTSSASQLRSDPYVDPQPAKEPAKERPSRKSLYEARQANAPPGLKTAPKTTKHPPLSTVPDRVSVILALDRGIPIDDFRSPTELFACFRDAIRGHYWLLTAGGILHRDISCNNIMIIRRTRQDRFRGFLIDLDHSIRTDEIIGSSSPERTGTIEFMSTRILTTPSAIHTYFDDLQSFLWVFIWICTRFDIRSGLGWGTDSNYETVANNKDAQLFFEEKFDKLVSGFGGMDLSGAPDEETVNAKGIEAAISIIKRIRLCLPRAPSDAYLDDIDNREIMYQGVVDAFDSHLPDDQKIGKDWMEMEL